MATYSSAPVHGRHVLGVAGGSVSEGADWANAPTALKIAAQAERDTAAVLDRFTAPGGAVVLHDLRVPGARVNANIDHVLVTGNHVHVVDSKSWRPGFMWTARGKTRRGFSRAEHVDGTSMVTATSLLRSYLDAASTGSALDAVVVVWPSRRQERVSTWAVRVPGAQVIPASKLDGWCRAVTRSTQPANPVVVDRLATLLVSPPRPTGHVASGWVEGF